MMKSTEAPPNKKVPQDTTSNPYPHRPPHDLMHMDMSSPRGGRVSRELCALCVFYSWEKSQ